MNQIEIPEHEVPPTWLRLLKSSKAEPDHEALRTPEETAQLIGVSPGTLAVWRSARRYPLRFIKVGSRVRYRMEDIQSFLSERTVDGQGAAKIRRKKAV